MSAVLLDSAGRVEAPERAALSFAEALLHVTVRSIEAWRWTPAQIVEARLRALAAETAAERIVQEAQDAERAEARARAAARRPTARAGRRTRRRGR